MTAADRLDIELRSDPAELPPLRERIKQWTHNHGWSDQQISEIVLALDEALTNVIRHGYGNARTGRIELTLQNLHQPPDEPCLEIRIRDYGCQTDPEKICGRNLDDVRPGGLGVHIIRSMTSSTEYSRAPGGGMLLVMRKSRSHVADRDNSGAGA